MKLSRTATDWLSDPEAMAYVKKQARRIASRAWKRWIRRYIDGWQWSQSFDDAFLCGNIELLIVEGDVDLQDVVSLHARQVVRYFSREAYYEMKRVTIGEMKDGGQDFTDWFTGRAWANPEVAADANKIALYMVEQWGIRSVAEMIDGEAVAINGMRGHKVRRHFRPSRAA